MISYWYGFLDEHLVFEANLHPSPPNLERAESSSFPWQDWKHVNHPRPHQQEQILYSFIEKNRYTPYKVQNKSSQVLFHVSNDIAPYSRNNKTKVNWQLWTTINIYLYSHYYLKSDSTPPQIPYLLIKKESKLKQEERALELERQSTYHIKVVY